MGLCGVGESHAPDAFAAVLNPTTDTHLSATRIHNDGIMQGAALPSTPPVWVATVLRSCCGPRCTRFYPRHPCGWRPEAYGVPHRAQLCFYPRHPCGWRRYGDLAALHHRQFLSTPPVWVATLHLAAAQGQRIVSIHATRVGGDI